MSHIEWRGDSAMITAMHTYEGRVYDAIDAVATYFAGVFEAYAKANAPWTDRTGNARQSLYAFTQRLGQDVVALYLAHGVDYGIYLEVANEGRYAVVWPTIQAHLTAIAQMLAGIFV
jgi:hypothetical protein